MIFVIHDFRFIYLSYIDMSFKLCTKIKYTMDIGGEGMGWKGCGRIIVLGFVGAYGED